MPSRPHPPADSGFDQVAWFYDGLAFLFFGNKLKKAQSAFLNQVPANARILLMGGGTGWLLKELLLRVSPAKVVYIEASAHMLARAQQRLSSPKVSTVAVEFRLGNEQSIRPSEKFEVVVTPFFLDLFTSQRLQQEVMPILVSSLLPNGRWLFADFIASPRWYHRLLIRLMYWFFGKMTRIGGQHLPDYAAHFHSFGLRRKTLAYFYGGMVEASSWVKVTISTTS